MKPEIWWSPCYFIYPIPPNDPWNATLYTQIVPHQSSTIIRQGLLFQQDNVLPDALICCLEQLQDLSDAIKSA